MSVRCVFGLMLFVSVPVVARAAEPTVDFDRDVRPILSDKCFACHGPDEGARQAKLRLDVRAVALKPAESGTIAIVPGKVDESALVKRIFSTDADEVMPPKDSNRQLSDAQKETLKKWIAGGANYAQHWAFVSPQRPAVPEVAGHWSKNDIDRFVLARLQKKGLAPTAEATRETLIRRVTFDLTGLPPKLADIDAFLADQSPDAYEKVVDRLLASPQFGERLGLDWLDAARYADTHGYHIDSGRDMTKWREYVIDAFNNNKPFDQFIVEQMAGDLLPNATLDQKIASGFNRNHMINFEGGAIPEEYLNAYIVDRVNTFGTVFLGLTVGCAQCHDHKYDPLTQREYYGLYAFFHNVPEKGLDGTKGNAAPFLKLPTREQEQDIARLKPLVAELEEKLNVKRDDLDAEQKQWEQTVVESGETATAADKLPKDVRKLVLMDDAKRSDEDRKKVREFFRSKIRSELRPVADELAAAREKLSKTEQAIPTAMVMEEMPQPRDTYLLVRGAYDKKGEKVTAVVPAALPALADDAPRNRLGLAQWLVSPEQPLTSRVLVNRYWQMFFGNGLVKSAEDFGSQGEQPSHPELLDWLACEFRSGSGPSATHWNLKELVRLMVTSATYRQSSSAPRDAFTRDPENRLLARGPRFRLQAEFIRDQALAISGLLNGKIGGSSVSPYQPKGLWEELMSREDGDRFSAQKYVQSHGADLYRRTMYTFWKRTCPPPTLATFDAPDRETCTVRRARTNTPLQALVLLNDPTYVEASRMLAERILKEGGDTADSRIDYVFRLTTARRPTDREHAILMAMLRDQTKKYREDPAAAEKLLAVGEAPRDKTFAPEDVAAWATIASAVLNLDESVTRN